MEMLFSMGKSKKEKKKAKKRKKKTGWTFRRQLRKRRIAP